MPGDGRWLCMGWAMMMLAKDAPNFVTAPWDFVGGIERS